MRRHQRLMLSLALSFLVGVIATEAQAAPITMTIDVTGGSFLVDLVATSTPTTYNVDAPGLAALNAFLLGAGSEYQFVSLGGSSNFPGNASLGNLVLTGEIHSAVGGGPDSFLKITESEDSFTSPTGPSGTLDSSSTGNFTLQPAGGGHTASSAFNATSTPSYAVLSSGVAVNGQAGAASVGVAPVSTLYTLTNVITFGLAAAGANDVIDSFGVTATITAVPEPSSSVMLLMGLPVPLVLAGLLRRYRRATART